MSIPEYIGITFDFSVLRTHSFDWAHYVDSQGMNGKVKDFICKKCSIVLAEYDDDILGTIWLLCEHNKSNNELHDMGPISCGEYLLKSVL